jgi:hypothetical protein
MGYDDEVEGFAAVYEDAEDTWVGGSLDTYDVSMEWYWRLPGRLY